MEYISYIRTVSMYPCSYVLDLYTETWRETYVHEKQYLGTITVQYPNWSYTTDERTGDATDENLPFHHDEKETSVVVLPCVTRVCVHVRLLSYCTCAYYLCAGVEDHFDGDNDSLEGCDKTFLIIYHIIWSSRSRDTRMRLPVTSPS